MKQLSAWIACGLCACGHVTAPGPDAGGGSGGPMDTAAPMLVSSTPAASATGVTLMATLTLVFDEPLDPASVTPDAFSLGCWSCSPVFTTPAYDDATRTVTLVPLFPLEAGRSYELAIGSGLRDVAGNAFAGATVAFRTRMNPVVRIVQYNTSSGAPTSWNQTTLDGSGAALHAFGYGAAGTDGVWFTLDDVASSRTEWVVIASGAKQLQKQYAAGADGKFGTADDVVTGVQQTDLDPNGNATAYWTFDAPGADGRWETSDDHVAALSTSSWDGSWLAESDSHDSPGADGRWNTAEDVITRIQRYEHDARGRLVREIELDAGPDQRAGTADDTVIDYSTQEFDPQDQYARHVFFYSLGVDGMAGTADDGIGPDGVWFTADDVPDAVYTHSFDAAALVSSGATYLGPGPDHVWLTSDDAVYARYATTYDARRTITGSSYYTGAGSDGLWGTADDALAWYTIYHRDSDGLALDYTDYAAPGPDGLWHTADDRPDHHYDFDDTH